MGLRDLIHRMTAPAEKRGDPNDERYWTPLSQMGVSSAGIAISDATATSWVPLFAAIRNLSDSVADLPLFLYRRDGDVTEKAKDLPLYRVLHSRANPLMSAYNFRRWMMNNMIIRGNGYAQIVRDGDGNVAELWPLPAGRVKCLQDPTDRARVNYEYRESDAAQAVAIPMEQMFHIRGYWGSGLLGQSLVSIGREAIGLGIGMEDYSATFFKNGAQPGGVLTHPTQLSPEAAANLKKSWNDAHGGPGNRHSVAVLEEGMGWVTVGVTPEDSQLLESKTYQVQEVARLFNMPPHRLMDLSRATFSNIEVQGHEYVVYCLGPWLVNWTQQIAMDLIPREMEDTLFAEFNVDALLRGQSAARADFLNKATGGPWQTVNETRALENLPSIEGGDKLNLGWQAPKPGTPGAPGEPKPDEPADVPADEAIQDKVKK